MISTSPGELQPVFNTMLENALRICEAKFGVLFRIDDGVTYPVAMLNLPPAFDQYLRQRERRKPRAGSDLDMLCRSREVVHTVDMLEMSSTAPQTKLGGSRTQLAVPMLKDGGLVGVIVIYRQEVRPFTEKQIELVQNFAAQAVIAIENTRLLNELRESCSSRRQRRRCCRSSAVRPASWSQCSRRCWTNAIRICDAKFGNMYLCDGDAFRLVAAYNAPPALSRNANVRLCAVATRSSAAWSQTKGVVHIVDLAAEQDYLDRDPKRSPASSRSHSDHAICSHAQGGRVDRRDRHLSPGGPSVHRQADRTGQTSPPRPSSPSRTRACSTSCANSLQQQTATADVLKVISSSPGELQPVFETMLGEGDCICEASIGTLFLLRRKWLFAPVALHGSRRQCWASNGAAALHPPGPRTVRWHACAQTQATGSGPRPARPILVRRPTAGRWRRDRGIRTIARASRCSRSNELVGALAIYRQEIRPFTDKQIELIANFAARP